jgi:hypothetical protein
MKKFLALGYMLALPLVSGAKILPSVVFILFFTTSPPGLASGDSPADGLQLLCSAVFGYFVSGFFPTTGGIATSSWGCEGFARRQVGSVGRFGGSVTALLPLTQFVKEGEL